jgi:hypothetical protein
VKTWVVLSVMLGLAQTAAALDADEYRGGWETYDGMTPHVLELSIRGTQVRGVYCTDCSDATTLAFVDGTVRGDDIAFTITHVKDDGSTEYREHAAAQVRDGQLLVAGGRDDSRADTFKWTMRKDPRGPAPVRGMVVSKLPRDPSSQAGNSAPDAAAAAEPRRAPPPYTPPGPWETLGPAKLVGVWIGFGAGIDKQYFIIRKVAGGLRGMVCGRCDNPYTMSALDDFHVAGDTLTFNILHEDWGPGSLPNHNQVTAHVSKNEMRISTMPDNVAPGTADVPGFKVEASLMGPIAAEATRP